MRPALLARTRTSRQVHAPAVPPFVIEKVFATEGDSFRIPDRRPPSARNGERQTGRAAAAVEVVDRSSFMAMAREWNVLVDGTCDEPFYRHDYLCSWIDNFAPRARLKCLTSRDADGQLAAALPLVCERGSFYGFPVRQLVSPTNVHSFRFDLIAADAESAARSIWVTLAADPSWDLIKITDVPEGGNAWRLYRMASEAGFPTGAWECQRSPYIPLASSYDEMAKDLTPKFKSNLRRRRKKLEARGAISVERVTGGGQLQCRLEECFALERSGWKGRQGSAAGQSRQTHGFYSDLAYRAASEGYLSLYFLKLDGKPIASQYGLIKRGVFSLLLTSYDESFKEFSPSQLLLEEVTKNCIVEGMSEFDFLGCDLEWKLDWSTMARPHHWLFIFRNNLLGRTLRNAKFDWIPAGKRMLKRWKGAHGTRPEVVSGH